MTWINNDEIYEIHEKGEINHRCTQMDTDKQEKSLKTARNRGIREIRTKEWISTRDEPVQKNCRKNLQIVRFQWVRSKSLFICVHLWFCRISLLFARFQ
jgi:hypothetical protein